MASAAALIAIVKVKAKADQTASDLASFSKDLDRLEKDAHHTTRLLAQVEQLEKNVSKLWEADALKLSEQRRIEAQLIDKMESHRDRLDDRFIQLRDKINGDNR